MHEILLTTHDFILHKATHQYIQGEPLLATRIGLTFSSQIGSAGLFSILLSQPSYIATYTNLP